MNATLNEEIIIMSGRDRMKASDVFRETAYVFSKKVPFEEAFPEIKDFRIEVQTLSEGSKFVDYISVYTMQNKPGEYIDCRNPLCYNGGFSIGQILREMVRKKQSDYEGSALCQGYEGSPKGRRQYRSCTSHWKVKVHVNYKEPTQGTEST
jgi:hypothetical protein